VTQYVNRAMGSFTIAAQTGSTASISHDIPGTVTIHS